MKKIIFAIIVFNLLILLLATSGCFNGSNENDTHFIYVIYSKPMSVNTTVYVDNELIFNLTNKTYYIYPPVSEIIELNENNEYLIEIHDKNLNLYMNKTINMNGDIYISIFITENNISIKTTKEETEFL